MHLRRSLAVFWIIAFLLPPSAYALPLVASPVTDPTQRLFSYDTLNRLTGVTSFASSTSLASFAASYDGEGKPISVTEGGVTTTCLYDGLLPVLERQGSATTVNVWGLSLGGGIGGLLARVTPTGTFYPLYDGSGNILAWTDSQGQVVSTTTYTAFGEVVARTGSDLAGSDPSGFGFSTKSHSSVTGLSYFGARYYSASLGRWLTPDPLGMVDGPNVYGYVRNNPINRFDPFGLSTEPGLIDETDVMIDVGSITIGVILPFIDGPLLFGDAAGAGLVAKGTRGLAGKGRVVIGENMRRVTKYAHQIGAEVFGGGGKAANRAWTLRARALGKEIIDIGPDFVRRSKRVTRGERPDSADYGMERMLTKGYEGYRRVFERFGRRRGGVPDLD